MILGCIHKNHLKITKKNRVFSEQFPGPTVPTIINSSNPVTTPLHPLTIFSQLLSQFSIQSEMSIVVYRSYIYYYIPSIEGNLNSCQIIRDIFWNVLLIMKSIGACIPCRQHRHFTHGRYLNSNISIHTHGGSHNQCLP